jgi:hypothetical protein
VTRVESQTQWSNSGNGWQTIPASVLVLVSTAVGILSILKDIGHFAVSAWNQIERIVHWHRDRQVFMYIKSSKQSLHDVKGISEALHTSQSHVYESLNRLQKRHKVIEVEARLHLWGLHEFQ